MADVFRGGKVHVLSEKCASYIFRPVNDGRILGLRPGRIASMVQESRSTDGGNIPCHMTIWNGDAKPAICHGFWSLPRRPALLQIAERMGLVEFDEPPPKEA